MSLIVYKSSAGSGKTATLVLEYLRLCLADPWEFKRTLAITFTNKAANEMKSRIISTLELGASGRFNFLLDQLKEDLNYDDEKLKSAAQELLALIIHNYDEFAVSTIDSFVHRVIRTFANEVGLPANFEVILDKDEIVPEIIDELFDRVGNDKELTRIMVSFVMKQIEDEKSHDLGRILSEFVAYNLSEDVFKQKEFLKQLKLSDFPPLIKRLIQKQKTIKSEIENLAKKAIEVFGSVSLSVDDLSYKSGGIFGYYQKLISLQKDDYLTPGKRAVAAIEEDKWVAAKASNEIKSAVESIKEELKSLFYSIQEIASDYFLIKLVNSRIYSVALTAEIQNLFSEFVKRTGKVHISEFNKRISENIAGQPVPFLYERLGFKYRHFLIDEFQDTSVLQWDNLLPLIEESLANNNFNMLVGDAKQAIYRFRNGEVQLFTNLPKLFNNDGSMLSRSREDLFESQFDEKYLDVNYRSNKHIIEFNNDFFSLLLQNESDRFKKNYIKLEQKVHNNNDAYVKLNIVDAETVPEYSINRLEVIEDFIIESIGAGFNAGDICILCRTKKQIAEIASHLVTKKYSIVSSESLLVANSPKVSLIISFLRLMMKPEEKILLADFVFKYAGINDIAGAENFYKKLLDSNLTYSDSVLKLFGSHENIENLHTYSVYEVCEFVIRSLKFDQKADAFIQYFLDFVYKMQLAGNFTLKEFLFNWDERKSKIFVEMPEDEKAIKLMTAHKSKGLDFKVVIADLNYSKTVKSKDFWTEVNIDGVDILSTTLLPLNSSISNIGLENIYDEEQEKERLDFLNLVYVVFTRASQALFAVAHNSTRDIFGGLLKNYISYKNQTENNVSTYEIGKLEFVNNSDDKANDEVNLKLEKMQSTNWHSIIKIAESEDIYWEANDFTKPSSYGKLVHKILSEVKYSAEVDKSVSKYRLSGLIDRNEEVRIRDMINNVVNHPSIKKYFSEDAIVKNETELMGGNGNIIRPDRVVILDNELAIIDYKTGGKDKKHNIQILEYANVFSRLGYENISSFLIYLGEEINVDKISGVQK